MKDRKLLFQARLQYKPDLQPVGFINSVNRAGKLLGSGDGSADDERLSGKVRWSIFEVQGAICETNIVGTITAADGAKIDFETREFGLVPDKDQPDKWNMPAVVRFKADKRSL